MSFLFALLSAQRLGYTYVKTNLALLPIAVVNVGAEFKLSDRNTFQTDILVSPWKSFAGAHAQMLTMHAEGRHYFKEAFEGFYGGINIGGGVYNMTKWDHFGLHQYQKGYTYMAGVTLGYQCRLNRLWNLDMFAGGGIVQSQYKGYEYAPDGSVFRYDGAKGFNRSGEILPYRGGIMLSYKFR